MVSEQYLETIDCPICDSKEYRVLFRARYFEFERYVRLNFLFPRSPSHIKAKSSTLERFPDYFAYNTISPLVNPLTGVSAWPVQYAAVYDLRRGDLYRR